MNKLIDKILTLWFKIPPFPFFNISISIKRNDDRRKDWFLQRLNNDGIDDTMMWSLSNDIKAECLKNELLKSFFVFDEDWHEYCLKKDFSSLRQLYKIIIDKRGQLTLLSDFIFKRIFYYFKYNFPFRVEGKDEYGTILRRVKMNESTESKTIVIKILNSLVKYEQLNKSKIKLSEISHFLRYSNYFWY